MPKTLARGRISPKSGDNEKMLAINELQDLGNSVYRGGPFTASTAATGPDVIYTSETIPESAVWSVTLWLLGQATGAPDAALLIRFALFQRATGAAAVQIGATAATTIRSGAQVVTVGLTGNTVTATVSGMDAPYSWSTWAEIRVSI